MVIKTLKRIYGRPKFILLSLISAVALFAFIILFPNIHLLKRIFSNNHISLGSKVSIPFSLLGSIFTNFTIFSASYVILISILFGLYIGCFLYFIEKRITEINGGGFSLGLMGTLTGFLGIGCAACGMFIFTNFSLITLSGLSLVLPGLFFELAGIVFLSTAIYLTLKKISDPLICRA